MNKNSTISIETLSRIKTWHDYEQKIKKLKEDLFAQEKALIQFRKECQHQILVNLAIYQGYEIPYRDNITIKCLFCGKNFSGRGAGELNIRPYIIDFNNYKGLYFYNDVEKFDIVTKLYTSYVTSNPSASACEIIDSIKAFLENKSSYFEKY